MTAQAGPTAVSKAGSQFLAQPMFHTVVVTDVKGNSKKVGGVGRGEGRLNFPADVAVLGELAYVVETGNHRVQIFDVAGNTLGTIGAGVLNYPGGIAAGKDEILVSDSRNARIVGFDTAGRTTRVIGAGVLSAPRGLTVVDDGLLVADPGLRKVLKLDMEGRVMGQFGSWVLPWDVATDGTLVFVADVSANEIAVLDQGAARVETVQLQSAPTYISYRNGTLYVV